MKKRILSCFLIGAMVLSLVGCGGSDDATSTVDVYGDIEGDTSDTDSEEEEETNISLPYYDSSNLKTPETYDTSVIPETKTSYYKAQLSTRQTRAFDAIYNTAENYRTNVVFESSQYVTPSELNNIMNIIYLDCPEIFYLDTAYEYMTNMDGYVTNVYLSYSMSEESVQSMKTKLANDKPEILSMRKNNNNEYKLIKEVVESVGNDGFKQVSLKSDGSYNKSCMNPFSNSELNSIGKSKQIIYKLRMLGIDCAIVLGEPVSTELPDDIELVTDYMKFKEESTTEDGLYSVTMNYSVYWGWVVAKIDDEWYNIDVTYSYLIKSNNNLIPEKMLYFVPDRVLSQTRLFYMNEDILGISPSCTDNQYEYAYRNGYYVLSHTETQALLRLKQDIAEIDQQNKQSKTWTFEDEETFNYFLDNIDEQIESYNSTYNEPIGSYSITYSRDCLTLVIYNIVNNF
jgi:hypothetical protein